MSKNVYIGSGAGTGTLALNGSITNAYGVYVGTGNSSVGTGNFSAGSSLGAIGIGIGDTGGTGTVNDFGGTLTGVVSVGAGIQGVTPPTTGGNGTLNLSAGSKVNGPVIVGAQNGTGVVNATGSGTSLTCQGNVTVPSLIVGEGTGGSGTFNLSGGAQLATLAASIGGNGASGAVNVTGAGTKWTFSPVIDSNADDFTIGSDAAGLNGSGSVNVSGGASWYVPLSAALLPNSGSGRITVSPTGSLSVLSGGNVTAQAMNFSPGSVVTIGLDGPAASQNGSIDTVAGLGLAGTLDVTLENGFSPSAGQSFDLFSFGSDSGSFSTVSLPPLASGLTWNTASLYSDGTVSVVAVPEPSSAAVLCVGLVGLAPRRGPKVRAARHRRRFF
jgi:hypothetical protein